MQAGAKNSIIFGTQEEPKMPKRAEVRFTDAYIRNLKPADARYDVYDASLAGFGLRVSPSGT